MLCFNVQATFKGQECAGVYHSSSFDDYISIHIQYHVKLYTLFCIKLQNLDWQTVALQFRCCHDNTQPNKDCWSAFYIPHNSLVIEARGKQDQYL